MEQQLFVLVHVNATKPIFPALRCVPRADGSVLWFVRFAAADSGENRAEREQPEPFLQAAKFHIRWLAWDAPESRCRPQ